MATATLTYGSIYFDQDFSSYPDNLVETPLTASTPAKALGPTATMELGGFLATGNNRLVNDSGATRTYEAMFAGSMSASAGCIAEAHLYKNDALVTGSTIVRKIANAGDQGAFAVLAQVSLDDGQYVELWIESDGGEDLTILNGVLAAKVLG